MEVPFERLGPGQLGRFAYQVIGRDGPIYNPQNIRFMASPEAAGAAAAIPTGGIGGLGLVMGSASLLAATGAVVLSAITLREVSKVRSLVKRQEARLLDMDGKLDRISQALRRVEAGVAENNLRHALQHIVKGSAIDDGLDMVELSRCREELDRFIGAVIEDSPVFGAAGSLVLSADTRDLIESIYEVFLGLRRVVVGQHNIQVDGMAARVVAVRPAHECNLLLACGVDAALAANVANHNFEVLAQNVPQDVYERFTFADEDDQEHYRELIDDVRTSSVEVIGSFTECAIGDVLRYMKAREDEDAEEAGPEHATEFFSHWIFKSDIGLVYRTVREIDRMTMGYDNWIATQGATPTELPAEHLAAVESDYAATLTPTI